MAINKIASFNEKAETLFRPLLEKYGYSLEKKEIHELYGKEWSAHHIYLNEIAKLKIEIKQEPYYVDYGFSIFIYKLGTEEFNLLCNVPHENQDAEDAFLRIYCDKLFSDQSIFEIIRGK